MVDNLRLEELQRRVRRDPASISFAALAEEYRRAGLVHEAIETCRAGLQRHPMYLSARVTLGRSLMEIGEYDAAVEELEHVLVAAPENLAAIRALAEIHRRRGEMSESSESYQTASDVAPTEAIAPVGEPPMLEGLTAFLAAIRRARLELTSQTSR
jgi:predicted Zn-dependent protease